MCLTKLILCLYGFICLYCWSTSNSVAGANTEEILGVLLQPCDGVLCAVCPVGGQSPGLAFDITSFDHIGQDLAATITLRLVPGNADLSIGRIHHM